MEDVWRYVSCCKTSEGFCFHPQNRYGRFWPMAINSDSTFFWEQYSMLGMKGLYGAKGHDGLAGKFLLTIAEVGMILVQHTVNWQNHQQKLMGYSSEHGRTTKQTCQHHQNHRRRLFQKQHALTSKKTTIRPSAAKNQFVSKIHNEIWTNH